PVTCRVPKFVTWLMPVPVKVVALLSMYVPLSKSSVPSASVFQAPAPVPPLRNCSTPLCTSTVPLLFSCGPKTLVPLIAGLLLVRVPAFWKRALPLRSLSDWRLNVPSLVMPPLLATPPLIVRSDRMLIVPPAGQQGPSPRSDGPAEKYRSPRR